MLYVNHVWHWFSSGHKGQQGIKGINNGHSLLSIVRRDKEDRKARLIGERTCFWRSRPARPAFGNVYHQGMNQLSRFVSLHPYFKVPSDKMPHLKAILPEFAAKTRNETGNLFYEFTINGDEVFCREGYVDAGALLAHLENVGAMLAQALAMADLIRIEVHGPAAELAKLKEPLAHLKPAWFELHS
jgi:quinol monooxygenase YgiN